LLCCLPTAAQQSKAQPVRVKEDLPAAVVFHPDLVFARYGDRQLKLDLFMPREGKDRVPALVFVHGGGWSSGSKTEYRPMAQKLAARGYVCACIEHRFPSEAKFPAAIQDCKAAVRWLRASAGQYRIDPDRIGAVGGSTGGHLVNLLATSAGIDKFEGDGGNPGFSSSIQSVVNMAGTMDMTMPHFIDRVRKNPKDPAAVFLGATYDENPKLYVEASPITHITCCTPPMLHMDGEHDKPAFRTEKSRQMLRDLGIRTELIVVKDGPHAFWLFEPWFTPALDEVSRWFSQTLKLP
jgi:acetyl esterase/lipase